MKRTIFISLLTLALTGCTANPTPESDAYATDAPTEEETLPDATETPVEETIAEETTETHATDAPTEPETPGEATGFIKPGNEPWEQTYRTFLEPYFDTEALFSLTDVCGDRIPELFFTEDKNAENPLCQLYTYTDTDGLVYIGEMEYTGEISLNLQNGYLLHTISSDGNTFYYALEITEDHTMQTLITLVLDNSAEDSVRYINDEIVSEEAFDSALEEYGFHWYLITLEPRRDVTREEIDTAIRYSYAPRAF